MENHALGASLLAALCLLTSCATSNPAPHAMEQLESDAHLARLEAIEQLGRSSEPGAGEALLALIDEPNPNTAEREATWFEVARALGRLGEQGHVGEEALAALDELAARPPSVVTEDGTPSFPFDHAAAEAARQIRLHGSKRASADGDGRTQADYLAELAWIQRVDEDEDAHRDALAKLEKLGLEGVNASAKLIGRVRNESRGELVAYFTEMYTETGEAKCLRALTAVAISRQEEGWSPALVALHDVGDAHASERLVEFLEEHGTPDSARTHSTLSAIGSIGSEAAVPFLADLFVHESVAVARSASEALIDIGPASVPELMERIDDIDHRNRMMAALALSRLGDARGREAARRFVSTAHRFGSSDDESENELLGEIERNLSH